jgi:hypothetical protein
MQALTVRQPWAWYLAHGKDVENRTWSPPLEAIGSVLAIHASRDGARWLLDREIVRANGLARAPGYCTRGVLSFGAVVGVSRLLGWVEGWEKRCLYRGLAAPDTNTLALVKQARDSAWAEGPIGWMFEPGIYLTRPIPCAGRLKLWDLPFGVEREIKAQVGRGRAWWRW